MGENSTATELLHQDKDLCLRSDDMLPVSSNRRRSRVTHLFYNNK